MLKFTCDSIKSSTESLKIFTVLSTAKNFEWMYSMINGNIQKNVRYLSFYDNLLVVLRKLKFGLYNKDLTFCFRIKPVTGSRIFWRVFASSCKIFAVFNSLARKRNNQRASVTPHTCLQTINYNGVSLERPLNLNAWVQARSIGKSQYTSIFDKYYACRGN